MKRYLVYQDERSHKFWEIRVDGPSYMVTYGRVGTAGQTTLKEYGDDEACLRAAEKIVAQKLGKGYQDAEAPAAPTKTKGGTKATRTPRTTKTQKKKAAPKKAAPKKAFSPRTLKAFYDALKEGALDRVKKDLERGLPLEVRFDYWGYGAGGETPLSFALAAGQDKVAALLIKAGADVNATGAYDHAPLHNAKSARTAALLLDHGANIGARARGGATPLHRACQDDDLERVRCLVERGADLDAENDSGETPFNCTISLPIRDYLLARGARGLVQRDGRELEPKKVGPARFKDVEVDRGFVGVDRAGNLWLGGYAGLFRLEGEALTRYQFEESFALDGFALGPDDTFYIATNWGLIHGGPDGRFRLHDANNSPLHDGHITYIQSDPSGAVYIVGYEGESEAKHISVFDGRGGWRLLRPGVDIPSCDPSCLAFDGQGGLLIGVDEGFYRRAGDGWVLEADFGDQVFDPHVYDIVVDHGAMWIGTGSGVYRREGKSFTLYETENLAKHLCLDGDLLWIGTNFGGVYRLQISDGSMTLFNEETSALPHDDIEGLRRAPDGTIWIHAGSKLARIKDGEIEEIRLGR